MASEYPPPPDDPPISAVKAEADSSAASDSRVAATSSLQQQPQQVLQSSEPDQTLPGTSDHPYSQYEGAPLPAQLSSAVAAAHHGLQALEAATAASSAESSEAVNGALGASISAYLSPLQLNQAPYFSQDGSDATVQTPASPSAAPSKRQTRLRKACDMCSARKVKCDESGPPCQPCASLNVECTFYRATKRRGPPNKHAEAARALKQPRLASDDAIATPSPNHAAETLISIAANDVDPRNLEAESIAPWGVLALLVDDFFTYIHPLAPFPHEPSFRHSFLNREDQTNREFLALLASMIGCLVASFPRSARGHLKALQRDALFPRAITMVERCRLVALEARGASFSAKAVTAHDAATSYFLGLSAGYTYEWRLCRRYMIEALSFVQELGFNRPRDASSLLLMYGNTEAAPINHIDDQIGKRIFYVLLLGFRSMTQLGISHQDIMMPPPTDAAPYPDRPLEIDDEHIFADQILAQPEGTLSLLAGFNKAIDVYMTMNQIAGAEIAFGMSHFSWPDQKAMLNGSLQAVAAVTQTNPPELYLDVNPEKAQEGADNHHRSSQRTPSAEFFDDLPGYRYFPPGAAELPSNDLRHVLETQPERRRRLQYEIQKSNIYASQIATRSYFVEYYLNLRDVAQARGQQEDRNKADGVIVKDDNDNESYPSGGPLIEGDATDKAIARERQAIVQNLLVVLASIPQRNMEPNGSSLHNKIRQVASTLLNASPERRGPFSKQTEEDLVRFVEILMNLEKSAGAGSQGEDGQGTMTPDDEKEELRSWAQLREEQIRFAQSGGFMRQ